jgi:puromycin-sensitive aminopeptidase
VAQLPESERYRLPRTAVPSRYELELEPDLAGATFAGTCATTVEVTETTDVVVQNAAELVVSEAWLAPAGTAGDQGRIDATRIELDEELERLSLHFAEAARPGAWVLHTVFTGILNDKLRGFYRSTFTDADGNEEVIATTQMEATDARRAFPCWDEPDLKAVFAITMVIDPDDFVVSNAAEISRAPRDDGKHVVRFADTISMSTYLVAFVVGPLEATEPVDVSGVPLRVIAPRDKAHLADFALEVGAFCLDFFAEYFGLPYAGDKLDLVAVPDFAFGAMENLGCVTFREALVLIDPAGATQPELQNVTDVIAHELAHMWFGDLVTMKWWNGIWLNEAFATFMEMLATDAFRPEWERWVAFGASRGMAFDTDSLATTRPIEFPVVSPDDAEGMFDVLTYEKGAAVVRMLEQYLGPNPFREGIRHYMRAHQYANTETTDLWDAIEEVTEEPVRRIMDSWIFQGGYPLVSVDLDKGDTLHLTQERYTYASAVTDEERAEAVPAETSRWSVPLIYSQSANDVVTFEKLLLEGDEVDVDLFEPVKWVLANTEGTGFYRVHYAPDLLADLIAHAETDLSPIERYGLVDDAWASVLSDRMRAEDFLDLALRFGAEDDLAVWQRLVGGLASIDRLVDGAARDRLRVEVGELVRPALARLGTDVAASDSDRDRERRGVLIDALGSLARDPQVIGLAREVVAQTGAAPDPSVLAASIDVVSANGDAEDFDEFHRRFKAATTPQEELRYLYALANFDDADLVGRLLTMTLTDEIRSQNAPYVLARAMANRDQGPLAWAFVRDEWDAINERFPSNSIVRMLAGIRSLARPEVADDVFAFFETHEVPQGDKQLAQHLEKLDVNLALWGRAREGLTHHLTR